MPKFTLILTGTMVLLMYHNLSCTQSTVVRRVYHYFNAVLFAVHKHRLRTTYLIVFTTFSNLLRADSCVCHLEQVFSRTKPSACAVIIFFKNEVVFHFVDANYVAIIKYKGIEVLCDLLCNSKYAGFLL